MAVEAQAAVHQLQIAPQPINGPFRAALGWFGVQHLDRMAALVPGRAAHGIAQRFGPTVGWQREIMDNGRVAVPVAFGVRRDQGAGQNPGHIGAQFSQLFGIDHMLENIEAGAPIGLENFTIEVALAIKFNGAAISQSHGAPFAVPDVSGHRPGMFGGG